MYSPIAKLNTPEDFSFPYIPYSIQQKMMQSVFEVIENKEIGIFESPTGTGKSLTLTCGTLRWLMDHEKLVKRELQQRIDNLKLESQQSSTYLNSNWILAQSVLIENRKELQELSAIREAILDIESVEGRQKKSYENIREDNPDNSIREDKGGVVRVFFCSRTHSQLAQVVREIKRTVYGAKVRCVTLASRQHLCIHPVLKKGPNTPFINEFCLEMIRNENKSLRHANHINSRSSLKEMSKCPFRSEEKIKHFSESLLSDISDIEDTVKKSELGKVCGYYASRVASQFAQLIMVPYQIILHRKTRVKTGISLKNSVVIFDEAHNLLDSIVQINSSKLSLCDLTVTFAQITIYKKKFVSVISAKNLLLINQLLFITKQLKRILTHPPTVNLLRTYEVAEIGQFFNIDLAKIIAFCEESRFEQKLENIIEKEEQNLNRKLLGTSNPNPLGHPSSITTRRLHENPVKNPLRAVVQFLESLGDNAEYGRVLISTDDENNSYLKYILLNAGTYFEDVISEARAIIIAGGTMQPTTELTQQLLFSKKEKIKEYIFDHVVPSNAVLPFVVSKGPSKKSLIFTYGNRERTDMIDELGKVLLSLCKIIPAGLICFVPSYDYLEKIYEHLADSNILRAISANKEVLRESNINSSVEKLLKEYSKAIERGGALLFSVVGGNLSEGLNFSDDMGRGIIVVGLPYPNRSSTELQERMKYLDEAFGKGAGNEFYENKCLKSVNQCIGRSVRHINDYACVYLLDDRYGQERIKKKLPKWIQSSLTTCANFETVEISTKNFFHNKNNK